MKLVPLLLLVLLSLCNFLSAADYFWVGGAGNWSDISHWATNSGGNTQHAQTPTAEDNVFFDVNSFSAAGQTVTIDIDIAFCQDLDFSGALSPRIVGTANRTLQIFGSLIFVPDMQFDFMGDMYFRSNEPNQSIRWAGHPVRRDIYFDNVQGGWIIEDDMLVDSVLVFISGELNISNITIEVFRFLSERPTPRSLVLDGASIIINSPTQFNRYNLYLNEYPLTVNTNGILLSSSAASIEFPASNSDLYLIGSEKLSFGKLIFSSASGTSTIRYDPRYIERQAIFEGIEFHSNGIIYGNNKVGLLGLSGGKSYKLESRTTQNIDRILANGSCNTSIFLSSSTSGSPAIIQSNMDQQFNFLTVRDIRVDGGASFAVTNAIDLGNNQGWDFDSRISRQLYWTGNSGSWDDPAHWSLTDGGTGGECPPTAIDDVFFTSNSFVGNGQLSIDVEDALCHDFRWQDLLSSPSLIGAGNLHIFGSVELHANLMIMKNGSFLLEGSGDDLTIECNSNSFSEHLVFNGTGTWTLRDGLTVEDSLVFLRGNLVTENQDIQIDYFISRTTNPRNIQLGNSHILIPDNELYSENRWYVNVENFNLDAGTSLIEIVDPNTGVIHEGRGSVTYYDMDFTGYGGFANLYVGPEANVNFHRVQINSFAGLSGRHFFGELVLTPGKTYTINNGDTISVGQLTAVGTCEEPISILAGLIGVSYIHSDAVDQTVDFVILKNIHAIGSARFEAIQSVDLGRTEGWDFDELISRARYWVGGSGNWHDINHWSYSSGGMPGACIPSPVDDVFFDQNSFTAGGQVVELTISDGYCRSMSWAGSQFAPQFLQYADLYIYGSVQLISDMTATMYQVSFVSDTTHQTIDMAGHSMYYTTFSGLGEWTLEDSLRTVYWINIFDGSFNTAGYKIHAGHLFFGSYEESHDINIDLDSSILEVAAYSFRNGMNVLTDHLDLKSGGSQIRMTEPFSEVHVSGRKGLSLYDLEFTPLTGFGRITNALSDAKLTFNKVHIYNDGELYGDITFDSLLFSPGKTYTLESSRRQTINEYFLVRGNNCAPISMRASNGGQKAIVSVGDVIPIADFIQMQDQSALASRSLYAGSHSTNIGNSNTGWIFETAPDEIEFGLLGEDQVLCEDSVLVLNANSYSPNEIYSWNTGSTKQSLEINIPGQYSVQVQFGNNCILWDTVNVLGLDDFSPSLGNDTIICPGEVVALDARVDAQGVHYVWQDGSRQDALIVSQSGLYSVQVDLDGCTMSDTIKVTAISGSTVDLGEDVTICADDQFLIIPEIDLTDSIELRWQDQSSGRNFLATQEGIYWLDVSYKGCVTRDSLQITTVNAPIGILSGTREICPGETIELDASVDSATYVWQDSSIGAVFRTKDPGNYWVDIAFGQCVAHNEISVFHKTAAEIDLGADTTICALDSLVINLSQPGVNYQWSDGYANGVKVIKDPGEYIVAGLLEDCLTRDTIRVSLHDLPRFDLGVDTIVCQDFGLDLEVNFPQADYRWSDGSTDNNFHVMSPGVYYLTLDDGYCTFTDSIQVDFRDCIYYNQFIPNAISPNGDGTNDELEVFLPEGLKILDFHIRIFSRWGNLIFESSDVNKRWNGMVDGRPLDNGVYLYSMEMTYIDDKGKTFTRDSGSLTLIR